MPLNVDTLPELAFAADSDPAAARQHRAHAGQVRQGQLAGQRVLRCHYGWRNRERRLWRRRAIQKPMAAPMTAITMADGDIRMRFATVSYTHVTAPTTPWTVHRPSVCAAAMKGSKKC